MNAPDICIYHAECADGFAAAWAVRKRWPSVLTIPAKYGEKAPTTTPDANIVLVDFSYPAEVMRAMAREAASLTVLDHHKTARADCEPLLAEGIIQGQFDMNRAGCGLAWDWAWPREPMPKLLHFLEDRDLWRFALPNTRNIYAAVTSYPFSFDTFSELVGQAEELIGRDDLITEGVAIERSHRRHIIDTVEAVRREMTIGGHRVPVANLPYFMASDGAGHLAETAPFAASYIDTPKGRQFSLRSRGEQGMDVSEIARRFGGGGHRNAAGFTVPLGWEGDSMAEGKRTP